MSMDEIIVPLESFSTFQNDVFLEPRKRPNPNLKLTIGEGERHKKKKKWEIKDL